MPDLKSTPSEHENVDEDASARRLGRYLSDAATTVSESAPSLVRTLSRKMSQTAEEIIKSPLATASDEHKELDGHWRVHGPRTRLVG